MSAFRPAWVANSSGMKSAPSRKWAGRRRKMVPCWSWPKASSTSLSIALVVLVARRNKIEFLLRILPELQRVLENVQPGQVYRVGA